MNQSVINVFKSVFSTAKYLLFLGMMLVLTSLPDMFLFAPRENLLIVLLYIFLSGLIIIFLINRYKKSVDTKLFNIVNQTHFSKQNVLFTTAMYGVMWGIDVIFNNLIQLGTPENQEILEDMFVGSPIILGISVVIVAPIVEELIFRGIFTNYFFNSNKKYSKWIILLTSSLLFGLAHEVEPSMSLLYYSSVGAVLGITYLYTKDIKYNIILHFINNSIALYYMYMG